jgi:hypothetical protein
MQSSGDRDRLGLVSVHAAAGAIVGKLVVSEFELVGTQQFDNGIVHLTYRPAPTADRS